MTKKIILMFACSMLIFSCKKEEKVNDSSNSSSSGNSSQTTENKDSVIAKKDSVVKVIEKPSIPAIEQDFGFYNAFVIPKDKKEKDSAFGIFNKKYTQQERYAILALNRLDSKNKYNADTLVVPKTIDTSLMEYSPFPKQIDVLSGVNKFVVFSYPIQAYAVYSNGTLAKWGPTSMGKKASPTKTGLTYANWKKELSISSVKSEWKLPYNFNIFNRDGIGWHEYDLPGYPASHSCLRLLKDDAIWLYKYADTWILNPGGATTKAKGTAVLVYGDYPWGKRKPWKNLLSDPNANTVSVEELTKMIEPNIDKILAEQQNRIKVSDSIKAAKASLAPVEPAPAKL
jgi:lipoprotein-anchoring transpeptidase ErfK/SrfK